MKINDVIKINGKLKILTGLHIGGEKESFKIGGVDNPVIKVLYNKSKKMLPYIPGSSLKGKIRYLLECSKDNNKTSLIKKLFGSTAKDKEESYGPTRLLFRDVYLTESSQNAEVTEIKPENTIDRKNGKAKPRFIERVVPGCEFEVEIILIIYEEDKSNIKIYLELLKEGFELLQNNYLGGSGSRGYGKVDVSGIIDNIDSLIKNYNNIS